jgi:hypothetical protein
VFDVGLAVISAQSKYIVAVEAHSVGLSETRADASAWGLSMRSCTRSLGDEPQSELHSGEVGVNRVGARQRSVTVKHYSRQRGKTRR